MGGPVAGLLSTRELRQAAQYNNMDCCSFEMEDAARYIASCWRSCKERRVAMAHFDPADDVSDLARAMGHTRQTWEAAGHTYAVYSDRFFRNRYVPFGPPQVHVVAASAALPAPKETANVGADGCFVMNSRADFVLRRWGAPIAAGRSAASKPLLVIGQSIWPVVTKALRQLHAHPTTYDRLNLSELPQNDQTVPGFRANIAYSRVVMVSVPSVRLATVFALSEGPGRAPALDRIQGWAPQHSFAYFTVWSPEDDLDHLPSVLSERYDVLTWRDSTLPAVTPAAPPQIVAPDLPWMKTIEASHLSLGGAVGLGLTPGQRLGLEPLSYRDAASAVMQEEAVRKARELNAMEGRHPKRLKSEAFMNPARVLNTQLQGFHADFGRFTHA
jgi:hypothetical protein